MSIAPVAVLNAYEKKLKGYERKVNGVLINTKEWSSEDEKVMHRLVTRDEMSEVWQAIQNEKEQLTFFECAWSTNLDYKSNTFAKNH